MRLGQRAKNHDLINPNELPQNASQALPHRDAQRFVAFSVLPIPLLKLCHGLMLLQENNKCNQGMCTRPKAEIEHSTFKIEWGRKPQGSAGWQPAVSPTGSRLATERSHGCGLP